MTDIRPSWATGDPVLATYYDTEWGMPAGDERSVFERLSLEVFQSGLSWLTILTRRDALRKAFHDFAPEAVAAMTESDVAALLTDASIIRNRRKINSTVTNARATLALRGRYLSANPHIDSGLPTLVWSFRSPAPVPEVEANIPSHSPLSVTLAQTLKARGFTHVGPVNMYALMQGLGVVNDHLAGSPGRARCEEAVARLLSAGPAPSSPDGLLPGAHTLH